MEVLQAFLNLVPVTLLQGVLYAFAALGIMIPFRLLAFPDLTAEGAFPLGAAVAAALIAAGVHPAVATLAALAAGFAAGTVTAALHLALKLNTLLCGILVVTALYSIDIRILGKPNIPLFAYDDLFGLLLGAMAQSLWARIALLAVLVLATLAALLWFLRTEAGLALRAVGASRSMARAQGISVRLNITLGLGLASALTAAGGALLAQNQAFADVNMGFGVLVNGLAAVIVGEQLVGRQSLRRQLAAPVVGAVAYYQVISAALALGLQPSDLKLLTAVFVVLLLAAPVMRHGGKKFSD